MSSSTKAKTPRTAEEQAVRDARKAAKKSNVTAVAGPSSATAELAETKQPKGVNAEDYEIDLAAPEPLSKAELRAAKKRAKTGGVSAEQAGDVDKAKSKRKRLPEYDPLEGDVEDSKRSEGKKGKGKEGANGDKDENGGATSWKDVKKQNSIWIGNLAFKTTPQALKEWVEKGVRDLGGSEGSVTRVNLPKKPGKGGYGESKGFAYVDLISPEMQKLAVGLSESMLEGRKLLIKLGSDHTATEGARTPKPAKSLLSNPILRNQPHAESATLFVGNLPFDATEEGLRDLIEGNATARKAVDRESKDGKERSPHAEKASEDAEEVEAEDNAVGEEAGDQVVKEEQAYRGGRKSGLRKVRLGAFEDTGRCKGFAFLDFIEPQNATAALSNRRNHFYGNRKLTLQYASESATNRSGGKRTRTADENTPAFKRPRPSSERKPRPAYSDAAEADIETTIDTSRPVDAAAIAQAVLGSGNYDEYSEEPVRKERKGRSDKEDVRGKKWQAAGRPRPGAALAMAKREKVGIVAGQGQKISFD